MISIMGTTLYEGHTMRSHIFKLIWGGLLILLACGISVAEDLDYGEVIEVSPDHAFIQVKDRNYKVSEVWILEVEDKPIAATPEDITEGALVKVIKGNKHDDYWNAESVTIYQGEMERLQREEMELPARETGADTSASDEQQAPKTEASPGDVQLKDGVYTN